MLPWLLANVTQIVQRSEIDHPQGLFAPATAP
jgi:hypothetical protein